MRILLLDLSKRFGGVDIRVLQTVQHLGKSDEVAVVVLDGAPIHRELEAIGARTFTLRRGRHDPRIVFDLRKVLRNFRPDVIDAHNPQSQLWGMLAARMAPECARMVTVHTIYREAHRGGIRQYGHEFALRLARVMGAEFLCVSGSIRDYLLGLRVPSGQLHMSYNAMEPLLAQPQPAGLRSALGIAPGDLLLAMIGRIEHVKAHDVMLAALAKLATSGRRFHLAIVGVGHEEKPIRALASDLGLEGTTHFLGFRRDIPAILAETDIFCIPSRSEGLPYTALEAARQGVPMIAAAVDGLAEVFEQGFSAEMVPSENVDALAAAVLRLADDQGYRANLGLEASKMIESRFAMPRMSGETRAAYEAAITRWRAG